MLTKGLSAEVRTNLEKCLSDIAEAVATGSGKVTEAVATDKCKVAKEKGSIRRAAKYGARKCIFSRDLSKRVWRVWHSITLFFSYT